MKLAWPHILNIILLLILVLLFMGVIDTRKPVAVSDQILGFMKQSKSKIALVFGEDGHFSAIKEDGGLMKECAIGPNEKIPQCEGLGPKGTVLTSQMFNVLYVRGSLCYEVIEGNGKATEYCF